MVTRFDGHLMKQKLFFFNYTLDGNHINLHEFHTGGNKNSTVQALLPPDPQQIACPAADGSVLT